MHEHALVVLGGQAYYIVGTPSPIDSARDSSEEKNNLSRNDLSLQAAQPWSYKNHQMKETQQPFPIPSHSEAFLTFIFFHNS